MEAVRKVAESPENKSVEGGSVRAIALRLSADGIKVERETVRKAINGDMELRSLAQVQVHRTSDANVEKRLKFAKDTLEKLKNGEMDLSRIIFRYEASISCSETSTNSRPHRVWAPKDVKAEDLPAEVIAKPTSHFSVTVMGHVCIAKIGALPVVLCGPGCKVNQQKYREMMEMDVAPNIIEIEPDLPKVWWQEDNAPAHSAKKMRKWLGEKFPNTIEWPAQSPGLSPLDYCINDYIKRTLRPLLPPVSKPEVVRATFKRVVREIPRDLIHRAIDHWPKRLQLCIDNKGGHIEHKLNE